MGKTYERARVIGKMRKRIFIKLEFKWRKEWLKVLLFYDYDFFIIFYSWWLFLIKIGLFSKLKL